MARSLRMKVRTRGSCGCKEGALYPFFAARVVLSKGHRPGSSSLAGLVLEVRVQESGQFQQLIRRPCAEWTASCSTGPFHGREQL